MIGIVLSFLSKYMWEILGGVAIALGLVFIYTGVQGWCNNACEAAVELSEKATAESKMLRNQIEVAQKRATDLALLWSKEITSSEKKYAQELEATLDVFRTLDKRAKGVSSTPRLPVTADTNRLLNDATAAANAPNPSSTGGSQQATVALPKPPEGTSNPQGSILSEADFTAAWVEAAKSYASCKLAWAACVDTYNGLRETQSKALPDLQAK